MSNWDIFWKKSVSKLRKIYRKLGFLYCDHVTDHLWANSWGRDYYSILVTFSDDAPFFVAPRGGFFVIAKDGTVRHVDQLGKQFYLFFVFISALARTLVFPSLIRAFPGARMWHCCGLQFELQLAAMLLDFWGTLLVHLAELIV